MRALTTSYQPADVVFNILAADGAYTKLNAQRVA